MTHRGPTDPGERFSELLALKSILTEIRRRLNTYGVSDAVKHLDIVDIALMQELIDLQARMPPGHAMSKLHKPPRRK